MKLSTREDVEAPIVFVYDMLCDFDTWERSALRRGVDVQRTDKLDERVPGMSWLVQFAFRGKPHKADILLASMDRPLKLGFAGAGGSFEGTVHIDLVELGPRRTRVAVISEAKPRTLSARIFMQSLKLARAKLEKRYEQRIGRFAAEIEDRFKRAERN